MAAESGTNVQAKLNTKKLHWVHVFRPGSEREWVVVQRQQVGAHITFAPYRVSDPGVRASLDDPETWSTLEDVERLRKASDVRSALVLGDREGITVINLFNALDGLRYRPWALEIVKKLAGKMLFLSGLPDVQILVRGRLDGLPRRIAGLGDDGCGELEIVGPRAVVIYPSHQFRKSHDTAPHRQQELDELIDSLFGNEAAFAGESRIVPSTVVAGHADQGEGPTTRVPFHPAAAIFPLLHGRRFERLKASIRRRGLDVPIVVCEGMIIDGRNRYRACLEVGVPSRFEEWAGGGSVLDAIVSLNENRRQLSDGQRALAAARIANLGEGRPRTAQIDAVSQGRAADWLAVKRTNLQKACKILDCGAPELVEAVEREELKIDAAFRVAKLSPNDQTRLLADGLKGIGRRASALLKAKRPESEPGPSETEKPATEEPSFESREGSGG